MSTASHDGPALRVVTAIPVSATGILPTDAEAVIREHLAPILGPWAVHSRVRLTRLPQPDLRRRWSHRSTYN